MRSEGMWDGETHCTHTPLISRDEVAFVNAGAAGIFMAQAHHGSPVKKGQLLGIIADPLTGNINERVTAPADGLLFTLREYPVVYPGSLLASALLRLQMGCCLPCANIRLFIPAACWRAS